MRQQFKLLPSPNWGSICFSFTTCLSQERNNIPSGWLGAGEAWPAPWPLVRDGDFLPGYWFLAGARLSFASPLV